MFGQRRETRKNVSAGIAKKSASAVGAIQTTSQPSRMCRCKASFEKPRRPDSQRPVISPNHAAQTNNSPDPTGFDDFMTAPGFGLDDYFGMDGSFNPDSLSESGR